MCIYTLGMKALSVAKETYIRINNDGIMCVQHQVIDITIYSNIHNLENIIYIVV